MILDYLKPTNYLSVEEEKELLKLCKQNNDSAKEKLVLSNIRFIYSEAKKLNSQKVSIDDLVVAGIQGLLEAIPKFDMSSTNRFMTFASFWIRKELFDYIYQNSSQLKISTPKVTLAIKLRKKYKIKIIACIPCSEQADKFSFEDKENYYKMIKSADEQILISPSYYKGCMQKRNRFMVDNCSLLIAYLTENKGGTFTTCNYAQKKGVEIILV